MTTLQKTRLALSSLTCEENHDLLDNGSIVRNTGTVTSLSMDFSSVGDFLRKAATAKEDKRAAIDERLSPLLEDPSTIGIPPEVSDMLESLTERYGDETYRQVALFCLGKWHNIHTDHLQQHVLNGGVNESLITMSDVSKLSTIIMLLDQVASFGGDEQWRTMIKELVGQKLLEHLEEQDIDPDSFFSRHSS